MPTGKYRFIPESYENLLGGGTVRPARDTQFLAFADLLLTDLMKTNAMDVIDAKRFWGTKDAAEIHVLLARRAYDLVKHTIENIEHIDLDRLSTDEHVQRIPDMTAWSEEETQEGSIAASVERFLLDPNHTKEEKQERVRQVIQALMEEGNVIRDIPLIDEWLKEK